MTSRVFKCSHHLFRVRIKGSATSEEEEEEEEEDMAGIYIYYISADTQTDSDSPRSHLLAPCGSADISFRTPQARGSQAFDLA